MKYSEPETLPENRRSPLRGSDFLEPAQPSRQVLTVQAWVMLLRQLGPDADGRAVRLAKGFSRNVL